MAMQKIYKRINWENLPSEKTPLDEINLNKMDKAIDDLDDRAIEIDNRISSGSAVKFCYIVGATDFATNWLSETRGGSPFSPKEGVIYVVLSYGDYCMLSFAFNGERYVQIGSKLNRKVFSTIEQIPITYSYSSYSWYSVIVYSLQIPNVPDYVGKFDINVSKLYTAGRGYRIEYLISDRPLSNHVEYNYQSAVGSYGVRSRSVLPISNETGSASYTITQNDLGKYFSINFHIGQRPSADGSQGYIELQGTVDYYSAGNELYSYEYIPKTEITDSKSGLIPSYSGSEDAIFMSDGKWHTLDELKEMLGIGSQP